MGWHRGTGEGLLCSSMRWVCGATVIQPAEKGKGNAKIYQLVEVLPMDIGKDGVIPELFESNLANQAYRGAFPQISTPA